MRTKTVVVREGEFLGPIDWAYNFRQHFDCYACSDEQRDRACDRTVNFLRQISESPQEWRVTVSHSFASKGVYKVGMYDGWPYWRPVPALFTEGTLGPEWHFFDDIVAIERISQ